jgi:hypothetical protein
LKFPTIRLLGEEQMRVNYRETSRSIILLALAKYENGKKRDGEKCGGVNQGTLDGSFKDVQQSRLINR